VAFGSLLIAIVWLLQVILAYIDAMGKKAGASKN
jgi:hypothetical protein